MDKVIRMCLIHDLGEAFTGDIPVFLKKKTDESHEEDLLLDWVSSLPEPFCEEMRALYDEMIERKTPEAKLYKALDGLEAVIAHNESDISTWLPNEYELQLTSAYDRVQFSSYLKDLREAIRDETLNKIQTENNKTSE
jgi:putative hydrolase of HD superfamily